MSSTYQRYACGTFLPYSLYLHRLFQKAYGEVVLRYAVAAKKLILNVSEPPWMAVVLRSSVFLRSKHVGKKCTGRTFFTVPAVNFSSRLGSTSPISKGLRKSFFQNGQGCPWFHAEATFLRRKNSRPEVYTDVHFWTGYFKRLTENVFSKAVEVCASTSCCTKINARRIRTAMDSGGFKQKQVCLQTCSPK